MAGVMPHSIWSTALQIKLIQETYDVLHYDSYNKTLLLSAYP